MAATGASDGEWLDAGSVATGASIVLAMLVGAIAMPLLIGRALQLAPVEVGLLVNASLAVLGACTLVQALGASPLVGVRLPVVTGAAFASLGPLLAIAADQTLGGASQRLEIIAGSTLACGVLALVVSPLTDRLLPLFPPVVRGAIMIMVGIVLLHSAVDWLAAPQQAGVRDLAAPGRLAFAAGVLAVIVAVARYGGSLGSSLAVLAGVAIGAGAAASLDVMGLTPYEAAPWFGMIKALPFGAPRFALIPALTVAVVMLTVMIEASIGFRAIAFRAGSTDSRANEAEQAASRGLVADGLANALAAVVSGSPCTTGPLSAYGLTAGRLSCAAAGAILLALGFVPKVGALAVCVPQFVLAGAGFALFGVVAATGVRTLGAVDYQNQRQNLFIIALTLGIGLVPLVAPQFFKVVLAGRPELAPMLQSSVLLAAVAAITLNLFFNGLGRTSAAIITRAAVAEPDGA